METTTIQSRFGPVLSCVNQHTRPVQHSVQLSDAIRIKNRPGMNRNYSWWGWKGGGGGGGGGGG